ncbi:MAG: kinase [Thermodesulfobacteriota bacterium]
MIITRTPFRISFFGGGTDYPAYYREYGGSVLNATINKYCYINCRYLPPFFEYSYRIRYSKVEYANKVDDISHPSVRECIKVMRIKDGLEMVHSSDIPAMSGIGSSSAFTVGFLHALNALIGKIITKRKLAFDAINLEQTILRESVGSQDQVAAAFGGLNKIDFANNGNIYVQPLTISPEKKVYLQDRLLFYFTGFARIANEIAGEQIKLIPKKINELKQMQTFVDRAVEILNGDEKGYSEFGKLLHESWMIKRSLSPKITTNNIDNIYQAGIDAGALGGKICGAGGGGFIVFYVEPDKQENVKNVMRSLLRVPIRFEDLGSHIIHYSHQEE